MSLTVHPGPGPRGTVTPPGDKSITHRALLLGLISGESVRVVGGNPGADCAATRSCAEALGATARFEDGAWHMLGGTLREPAGPLDCGNSGTTLRLLAGVLAGQPFRSQLFGDASLLRRPVDRVIAPLRLMGATLTASAGDRLPPLSITGAKLRGIEYQLPVASAQVASCLLFAGMFAEGRTCVRVPGPARDHTERMLRAAGVVLEWEDLAGGAREVAVVGPCRAHGLEVAVPGDFSSAAFFLAAAAATPGARVRASSVGLNPSRTGLLDVLEAMGAEVERGALREAAGEPVGDVTVTGPDRLRPFDIPAGWLPRLIDEVPAWAIAATAASGTSRLSGAGELRVKESDRLELIASNLLRLGIVARAAGDTLEISGGRPEGGVVESAGDHRIAMAFATLGCRARSPIRIDESSSIATSYPGFAAALLALGVDVHD